MQLTARLSLDLAAHVTGWAAPLLVLNAVASRKRGIRVASLCAPVRIVLAHLFLQAGRADSALRLAHEILAINRYSYNAYEILGMAFAAKGEWALAGEALEKSMALAPRNGPAINYGYVADIFSRAGNTSKWNYYLDKSMNAPQPARSSD